MNTQRSGFLVPQQQHFLAPPQHTVFETLPLPSMRLGLACHAIEQHNGGS